MLALDARFTVLTIFCGLATQWAAPGATVHAAVISRTPDDQPSGHSQHVFPWSGKGRPGSSKARSPEGGWKHKRPHRPHKRSHASILIPSNHGVTYALAHSRRAAGTPLYRVPVDEGDDDDDFDNADYERRGEAVTDGFVAIKSSDKTLAWLSVTQQNGEYTLNASENDKNLASLHKLLSASDISSTSSEIPVTLQIHPPDIDTKSLAVSKPLCATYNPNPSKPQSMTVTDCVDQTSSSRTEEGSQTFLYNSDTGVIRPTWIKGQDDGKTDKPAAAQAADIPSSSSSSSSTYPLATSSSAESPNPTSTPSASAITPNAAAPTNGTQPSNGAQTNSTSALNSREVKPAPVAQNVTLVFKPAKVQSAAAADVDSSAIDAQNSTIASSETTRTMTRTVTVFAAETGASSSSTASDSAAAAASQSAISNSIGVELVSGTPAATTIASSTISAQALVSASSSASSSTEASLVAASVTPAPSSSINAAAVASSLASSASASTSSVAAAAAAVLASASSSAGASGSATPEAFSSTSASASFASTANGSSSTFVAAVIEREAAPEPRMTPVSTEPYQWSFIAAEKR